MTSLRRPSEAAELMDDPSLPWPDFRDALEDIELSNRWLGGLRPIVRSCADLLRVAARDGRRPALVLDAGCGGADASRALCTWARAAGVDLRVLALDLSPHAVRHARDACRGEPWISVARGDAFALPLRPGAVDVVHAGMFLHHVPRAEQAAMLARLGALARVGVVVSDLRRTAFGYHGVRLFGAITGRRRAFMHDGPLSVARSFTLEEARDLARASGLPGLRVERWPFSRLTWVGGPWASAERQAGRLGGLEPGP